MRRHALAKSQYTEGRNRASRTCVSASEGDDVKSSTANIWAASITAALLTGAAVGQPRLGTVAFIRDGDLWVQDLRDGASSRLTQDGRNSMPRWSRSGEWIAFLKDGQAWVVRRNGRDRQRLAASGETVASVRWSPAAD